MVGGRLNVAATPVAEEFGLIALKPPFERVARFRPKQAGQPVLVSKESHTSSVIALMNLPFNPGPERK